LTGYKLARKKYADQCSVIFFPLDISWIAGPVIKKINPRIFIALETEIWPNVFRILYRRQIPTIILNARISNKAFARYRHISELLRPVLRQCRRIGVQNELYKQRYTQLGADPQRISVTGNLKLKNIVVDENKLAAVRKKYTSYLKPSGRLLWLAASTHQPEEENVIDAYQDLTESTGLCSLLLAPRHPERIAAIERLIVSRGFMPVRLSRLGGAIAGDNTIFLVDTVGDLLYLCSLCDICFVGGSLSGNGGHNILEPMHFLKPTVFGPSMDNFSDIAETALEHKAAIMVNDVQELRRVMRDLLNNATLRQDFAGRCLKVFESGVNILEDNLQLIRDCLPQKRGNL